MHKTEEFAPASEQAQIIVRNWGRGGYKRRCDLRIEVREYGSLYALGALSFVQITEYWILDENIVQNY